MLSHRLYLSLIEVRKFMERKLSEKSEIIKLIVDTIDNSGKQILKEQKLTEKGIEPKKIEIVNSAQTE